VKNKHIFSEITAVTITYFNSLKFFVSSLTGGLSADQRDTDQRAKHHQIFLQVATSNNLLIKINQN